MKKNTLLLKSSFLILFIFGFTILNAQSAFDGNYCPLGGVDDEYATGVVFSKAIDNNASGTCEIHTIWAKIVENTSEPSLRLAFKIGNNGSALYRIYLDTDNNPTAGLLYDSFGGPLTVLGAEYVLEIDSKDNGLARLLKWTGGNNLTDVTSDPLYDNFAGLNGDSDGCDGSDGKFIEFNIPFTILDLCDPDSPGVINIAQYATVSGGSPSSSRCLIGTLSFSIPLTGYVEAAPDTVCAGESTVLNLMGLTGNVTIIKWQYNEGEVWIDIVNSENTYTAENLLTTTRYRVVLQNTNICTDEYESDEVTVTVNPLPAAPTTSPVTYCAGDIATPLTATGTNLKWYTSSIGGIGSSTAPTPSTVSAGAITYYVSQTNTYNCEGPRASIVVTVNALPSAPTTSPMTYCAGDIAIPLTATGTNLKWYITPIGGTGSSIAPTPSTVLSGTTNYYVSQTNANNCEGPRASLVVTVNALPIINQVVALNPTIATCPLLNNGSITISATGANLQYSINNGGSYQTSNIFNGLTSGTYQIVVKNNTTNCLAYYTENVVLTNPVCISNVGIVTTTNAAEPNTNGLFTLTLTNPLVIDTEITYTVTGTASNGTDYATIGTKVTILANQTSVTIPVNVIDDNIIEVTETVIITLISTNTLVTVDPTKNIATVLITDNDGGPQNGLVINDVTVNENTGNAIFNVTLTGNVQGGFTVNYATANGSAIAPSDYTSTNGTLSFTGNNNEVKTITVPIINDNLIEPTENFVVNLSNLSTTLISINDGQGIGTILDNDGGGQNGLVINDVTVNESAGNAIFNVTLTGNVQGGFTVNYATANGSAIAPGDYTNTNGTLSFTGNNNEVKTITVPIIDDNLIEPTENFVVNLSDLSTTLIGINDGQGMGTILDNDGGGQNGLVINDVTVNENSGNATFNVTLTGNVQGGFTVNYATANGSAIAQGDYTSTNGTLSFTGNNNEVKTIIVPIIDDNLIEPTENFVVNLSNLSTALIVINDGQGMGTILDNDGGGQNGLVINDVNVYENAGNAVFTVTLTGNVQGGFTVNYANANGSAIAPGDYTSTNGTLSFTGNNNEVKTITVPIIDDNLIEPTENFVVNLSNLSTTLIGINNGQGLGTILDNDGGGNNGLSIGDVTVNEGAGTASFPVTLTGNVQGGITVAYATANGSASAPGDYTTTSGTLNFTGTTGEIHNVVVPIIDDNLIEPTENFVVNLSDLSTTLIGINDGQGMGTILDNDGGGQNGLVINNVIVNEDDGNAVFIVSLTGNVQGGFTVDYATANGSASAPGDYTTTSGTLNFTGTSGETHNVVVPIIDDNLIEPAENYFVNLSELTTLLIGINDGQGIGSIIDNDGGGQNGLVINDVTVNEDAGNALFTVTLTGNVQGGFTVDYATANGSAIATSDYTGTSGTLTFTGSTGETKTISVPIINDNLIEPSENFFVNLSELSTDLIAINDAQGLGTIIDNDGGPQNGLVINDVTVNEGAGNAVFTVTLTGNVQGGFTVNYATANGSASSTGDYTSASGTLTYTGNNNEVKTITIPIINDNLIEPTENFFVNLNNLSTTLIGINDGQGMGTIIDNDGGPQNGLLINDVTVNEGDGNAIFTVTLTGNVQGGFTVNYATANGSAIAPGDYTLTSGSLTFIGTTGETKTITVPIINDNLIEPTENFVVNLSNLSTTLISINDGQGIGTIADNDGGTQNGLVINNVTVNEDASNATFTVTLTGNVQGGFTVGYATANGSASAPSDYTTTSGTLNFTGTTGETHNIIVPIIDDNLIEPTENFSVNLSDLSTNLIGINDGQGLGTITDNDGGPQNGLVINNVTVNEDASNATFTVTLTGNVQGGFTVSYATANGSASAPSDYTTTSGTLNFTGTTGETHNIIVPIIDDNLIEPTENFFVNLSDLSTMLIGINDGQGLGTITDNDGGPQNGLVINDVTVNEDDGNATFTLTLTGNVQGGFAVGYATANGNASAPGDYTTASGTLNFVGTTGEIHSIVVSIIDDNLIEPTENFFVNLNELSTELIGIIDGQGTGIITDNDGGPQNGITINDVTVNEGDGNATFTVTLTGNVQGGFAVAYATAKESAITPGDYTNTNGILTFTGNNGETHNVVVPIIDDNLIEPTENFFVNLSNLNTSLIGINDNQGIGTIIDNDGGPQNGLVINDVSVNESDGNATFIVTLTGNVQGGFTVNFTTANGSATTPGDYTSTSGTLNFSGTTGETHNIIVPIIDDNLIEPLENFFVNLSNLSTTLIGINDNQGIGTITDNDGGSQNGLIINNITINENSGNAIFTVTLTGNVQGGFTVNYLTASGSALAPSDYTTTSGTLTFVGTTGETQTIVVPIINDNVIESTENFFVNLSDLSTVLIGINDAQGEGTIIDNDLNVNNDAATAIDSDPITINILANDSFGPDDTIVSVVITSNPQHGTVTIGSNNNVIYTANNGYFGLDTFSYTLTIANTDGSLNSGTATVTVTVNVSPNAADDLAETESNIPFDIDILANDTDADGTIDPASVTIIEEPENGTVVINTDGTVTYTPYEDFIGDDMFTYQVCDNDGLCDTATVSVVVAGVLAAELIIPEGFSPNDDGIHDEFDVEGLSNLYPDFKMVIYNRWGIIVYDYTHNGNPLTEPIWWDGYSRGRMTLGNGPAPVGTYFYTLYFNKDGAKPRSGYLYLNR